MEGKFFSRKNIRITVSTVCINKKKKKNCSYKTKVSKRAGISFYNRFFLRSRQREDRQEREREREREKLREAKKQRDLLVNMNPSRFLSFHDIAKSQGVKKEKKKKHLKEEYRNNTYIQIRHTVCRKGHAIKETINCEKNFNLTEISKKQNNTFDSRNLWNKSVTHMQSPTKIFVRTPCKKVTIVGTKC